MLFRSLLWQTKVLFPYYIKGLANRGETGVYNLIENSQKIPSALYPQQHLLPALAFGKAGMNMSLRT